ncbi:MAG: HAMP domain-containing sensor histidine kinase [Anaerolineaceae bacterium]|nr:HAMP domain-containing sensor histidine kinase [Anaerolineaceae bacterium]
MNENNHLISDPSIVLDQVFKIGQVLAQAVHWKPALDEVVPNLRKIIIFDNLVLYLPEEETGQIEVAYARVVGRGRSVGPEINWGESSARKAFETNQVIHIHPEPESGLIERLDLPHLLAMPLLVEGTPRGALVLIRFGGPSYTDQNIRVVAYLVDGIAQILRYIDLNRQLTHLEAKQRQVRLQEDFVSTISHELLTPLGFIKGYTTTLMRSDATWDEKTQHEFLTIIDEETDRLQELLDNMLDSARLQSGILLMEFQPVRLDALLRDVILRIEQHHKDLRIKLNTTQPSRSIQGDPRRLAQVFENLVGNAIKYAPGSPLSIDVAENDQLVHLSLRDRGPGIPSQYVPHLFERFFRNPEQAPNVRGTGLGLFICRQIIEAHQGYITIESEAGEGTTVHIDLPYDQQAPVKTSSPAQPAV